jgi:predicted dehydrogenase
MKPLRIVQVGMGGWGQNWAEIAIPRAGKAVETVAWVDADPVCLATVQQGLKLAQKRCFPSLSAALESVEADAVLITTTIGGHVPIAVEALAAGKHVLVEKPFAPSLAEAERAVKAAEAAGRMLMVSQNYRFFPAPRAVRELLASGELGPVGSIAVDFRRDVIGLDRPRHFALEHPLLVDMAIHHFDLMRMVLGQEPTRVSCHAWNPPWSPFAGEADGAATISFDGGAVASWRGSWVSPGEQTPWAGEWRIDCAEGEIRWTSRDDLGGSSRDKVVVRTRTGKERTLTLPKVQPHGRAGALARFAESVQAGIEPETSGRDNLGTIALVHAAVASAAAGESRDVRRET